MIIYNKIDREYLDFGCLMYKPLNNSKWYVLTTVNDYGLSFNEIKKESFLDVKKFNKKIIPKEMKLTFAFNLPKKSFINNNLFNLL